jgi:hypothetical protein
LAAARIVNEPLPVRVEGEIFVKEIHDWLLVTFHVRLDVTFIEELLLTDADVKLKIVVDTPSVGVSIRISLVWKAAVGLVAFHACIKSVYVPDARLLGITQSLSMRVLEWAMG